MPAGRGRYNISCPARPASALEQVCAAVYCRLTFLFEDAQRLAVQLSLQVLSACNLVTLLLLGICKHQISCNRSKRAPLDLGLKGDSSERRTYPPSKKVGHGGPIQPLGDLTGCTGFLAGWKIGDLWPCPPSVWVIQQIY